MVQCFFSTALLAWSAMFCQFPSLQTHMTPYQRLSRPFSASTASRQEGGRTAGIRTGSLSPYSFLLVMTCDVRTKQPEVTVPQKGSFTANPGQAAPYTVEERLVSFQFGGADSHRRAQSNGRLVMLSELRTTRPLKKTEEHAINPKKHSK